MNDLDLLSKNIEIEIHVLHDITPETYRQLSTIVESNENFNKSIEINDSNIISTSKLKPFSYKLLQYILERLENVDDKKIHHIIRVILTKAFMMFPNNTDIFIAYCVKKLDEDKDKFIEECLDDVIRKMDRAKKLSTTILFCIITVIVIVSGLCIINNMKKNNELPPEEEFVNGKSRSQTTR